MSKRDRSLLIDDMLEAAIKIKKFTLDYSFDDFLNDDKTSDAVIRNFEIIGEAAGRIDQDFKINHPQIEWKRIKGFRNRIIHEYFGIDFQIVWTIIEDDLDELIDRLNELR